MIRRVNDDRITELARGIVRGDYMIADSSRDWCHSLMLLSGELGKHKNLGLVLVPLAPHMGGLWLNGHVPGITIEAIPIAKGDVPKIRKAVNTMNAALFPERVGTDG